MWNHSRKHFPGIPLLSCSTPPYTAPILLSPSVLYYNPPFIFLALSLIFYLLLALYSLSSISTFFPPLGDNLWSTAMDWMPQFEHLDALKQLFPDRYSIRLQLPLRIWVIKSYCTWTYSLYLLIISSHLLSSHLSEFSINIFFSSFSSHLI